MKERNKGWKALFYVCKKSEILGKIVSDIVKLISINVRIRRR